MRPERPTCFRGWKVPGTAWADGTHRARKTSRQSWIIGVSPTALPLLLRPELRVRRNKGLKEENASGERRPWWTFPPKETT